jgi:chemotaxis methyl-accepting protein methylase
MKTCGDRAFDLNEFNDPSLVARRICSSIELIGNTSFQEIFSNYFDLLSKSHSAVNEILRNFSVNEPGV